MKRLTPAALAATVLAITACSSGQPAAVPAATTQTIASPVGSAQAAPVNPVPGTSDNEYVAGPFTITFKGIGPLPTQDDEVNEQGQTIPENCAIVDVRNTSNNFTGWVATEVEFVKGHSLKGQVLDTEPADPTGGSSGGQSSSLIPGQSQVLYACAQNITTPVYVEGQLISVTYGTPGEGDLGATTLQLKY